MPDLSPQTVRRILSRTCFAFDATLEETLEATWPWRITLPDQRPVRTRMRDGEYESGVNIEFDADDISPAASDESLAALTKEFAEGIKRQSIRFDDYDGVCSFLERHYAGSRLGEYELCATIDDTEVFVSEILLGDESWALFFTVVARAKDVEPSLGLASNESLGIAQLYQDGDFLKVGYRYPIHDLSAARLVELLEEVAGAYTHLRDEVLVRGWEIPEDPEELVATLTRPATAMLERTVEEAASRGLWDVEPVHLLANLLLDDSSAGRQLLAGLRVERDACEAELSGELARLRTGNGGKPVLRDALFEWINDAAELAQERNDVGVTPGHLVVAWLTWGGYSDAELSCLPALESEIAGRLLEPKRSGQSELSQT